MKPRLLIALLSAALCAAAAEPAQPPGFYELAMRWAGRSFAELEAEAKRGDSAAQFYLGHSCMIGRGVPRDYERGIAFLQSSAEQGNAEAITELARCHYQGQGLPQNLAEALRFTRDSVSRSNAAGLNLLGVFHSAGAGMPANPAEATRLFQLAAAGGNPVAMRTLGGQHLDGKGGFTRDAAEANRWFLRAAEAGHPEGMVAYGQSLLTGRGIALDQAAAVKWFLRAAASGTSQGLRLLPGPLLPDAPALLLAWRQAARLGDAEAQFQLARLVAAGETEPQGLDESPHRLLQAAAEEGHIDAALLLGDRYRWGYGGPRDLIATARWFRHGVAVGQRISWSTGRELELRRAVGNWGNDNERFKEQQTPEDRAVAHALNLYMRAARAKEPEAMREIARLYQRGLHVPADPVEAAAWLLLAQQSGSATAVAEAAAALQALSGEQQQQARERVRHLLKRLV